MVWAHYVPWFTPDNASLLPDRFYNCPEGSVGATPYRDEVKRALSMGIDGFFADMVAHANGDTAFWDLRPFLRAAEGTPFFFAICLDAKTTTELQARELVKMLSTYGSHPNYPKWKDRYVVGTYTYLAWTPDEWAEIRRRCAAAGYPIWVMANVETGMSAFSAKRLEPYADQLDGVYFFGLMGMAGKTMPQEGEEAAAFCRARGKLYMPRLHPAYFGAWLNGRNDFYQPYRGIDSLHEGFAHAYSASAQWLHLTTWNDYDETALEPRRLSRAYAPLVAALAARFKGEPPPAERTDFLLAYHREELPGTLFRLEALRLPARDHGDYTLEGRLLDGTGRTVAALSPRAFSSTGTLERAEWLVPTTDLAASPILIPEITAHGPEGARTARLPAVFFRVPCPLNPETIKVTLSERRRISATPAVTYADGRLAASLDFDAPLPVTRAVLYRDDRPVTSFEKTLPARAILPLAFSGHHRVNLAVSNAVIATALKSFETNGSPHFSWSPTHLESYMTPGWMRFGACLDAEDNATLTFSTHQGSRTLTPSDFVRTNRFTVGEGHIRLACDLTTLNRPTLDLRAGRLALRVWSREPEPEDAFWVRFEYADGTVGESDVVYPFARATTPLALNILETPVTLERRSGASGQPRTREFLTADADLPLRETKMVRANVSPLACRRIRPTPPPSGVWTFDGTTARTVLLGAREVPMNPCSVAFEIRPTAATNAWRSVLCRNGWQEAVEVALTPDGRVEASWRGGPRNNVLDVSCVGTTSLALNAWSRVRVVVDGNKLRLFVNAKEENTRAVPAARVYGNARYRLGGGAPGTVPFTGEIRSLVFGPPE